MLTCLWENWINAPTDPTQSTLEWWRCVNDILAIWTHGETALQEVLASLKHQHTMIKITATWSAEKVTFLHMRAHKDHNIMMDLNVKPTDTLQQVPPNHQRLFKTMHNYHHLQPSIDTLEDVLRTGVLNAMNC